MPKKKKYNCTRSTTRSTTHINTRASTSSSKLQLDSSSNTLFDLLDDHLLLSIITYVGTNQYRFVASINQRFKSKYMETFPGNTSTYWNMSTLAHTQICAAETLQRNARFCALAAKCGNLPALQWLRSVNCPWDELTCRFAATNGHFEVLQWCRQNGCPWDKWTCAYAAENGHFDVLHWCRQNGCPWDRTDIHRIDEYEFWCDQNECTFIDTLSDNICANLSDDRANLSDDDNSW